MVFYGLGIIASIVYLWFDWSQRSRSSKAIFFLAAIFFILFGLFQSYFWAVDHVFDNVIAVLFKIAPYALVVFSMAIVQHAYRRLKKRGWSRKYGALLILASVLLFVVGLVALNRYWWKLELFYIVSFLLDYFFLYLVITFVAFLVSGSLYRFMRPSLKKDYIIILGTGLRPDGSISQLLKHRLDAALRFYYRQIDYKETPATFIVSGGKGPDEPLPEAEAMKLYLMKKGIEPEQIRVEDDSVNTHQNFLYSKKFIEKSIRGIVFVTNNFHVLRSGFYARQMGVQAEGIGAKTPLLYLPYALVREYLALLLIFRNFHLVMVTIFLVASLLFFR